MPRGKLKPADEKCIRKNYIYLKEELDASDIVPRLFQDEVISQDDKERITGGRSKSEKNEILLDLLLQSGPGEAYNSFLNSLIENHAHVREKLLAMSTPATVPTQSRQATESIETDASSSPGTGQHIFISYCHADKELVHKIHSSLKSEGYRLWIDIEHMGDNLLDSMSHAVEKSCLVLMCISQKYKDSVNCRKEAEYTSNLKKDYIIVQVQRDYKPDGWLGLLRGEKLYVNFCGRASFDDAMKDLIKQIKIIKERNGPK